MLHNEARKLVLEAWDKTHNAREIAKYFSVNDSTTIFWNLYKNNRISQ